MRSKIGHKHLIFGVVPAKFRPSGEWEVDIRCPACKSMMTLLLVSVLRGINAVERATNYRVRIDIPVVPVGKMEA